MKVLLVGNGAREHIIAEKLAAHAELYAVMSKRNPAIARLCRESWLCDIEDAAAVAAAIRGRGFDLGFASPDATLAAGVSDVMEKAGMKVASPSKAASRIEWDKSFMRSLLSRHRIKGQPRHEVVKTESDALRVIRDYGTVAVKPLGLTGGKGVRVSGDHFTKIEDKVAYAKSLILKDGSVLIEEKLVGEEFTLQAFCDGSAIAAMPPVQDHKRAFEQDIGPNTGGMGSYSSGALLPFMEARDLEEGKEILQGVVRAMKAEGAPFRGVLYGQFMATADGLKVIEFNARFGDPEAMNVLALLDGSLPDILLSMADGKLKAPRFSSDCTVVKYLVPQGYPDKPLKDAEISVDAGAAKSIGASVYYASVYEKEGRVYTSSSRAIGVLGRAKALDEAEAIAEKACGCVKGPVWHRSDIGTAALVGKRIAHMRSLRGKP
ncbi:MAG: phosphoribosylamine--glycine ligase [Candidatus ainarchaeum sp.]|nr:phosphoribosylamine--glycine ligase [Candidatus ainarchaeum sp.]